MQMAFSENYQQNHTNSKTFSSLKTFYTIGYYSGVIPFKVTDKGLNKETRDSRRWVLQISSVQKASFMKHYNTLSLTIS